jgi:hypothetical protein
MKPGALLVDEPPTDLEPHPACPVDRVQEYREYDFAFLRIQDTIVLTSPVLHMFQALISVACARVHGTATGQRFDIEHRVSSAWRHNGGRAFRLFCFPLRLIALAVPTLSQTGQIKGVVTDPTRAAIAGAVVSLRNEQTKIESNVKSSPDGSCAFSSLLSDTYAITVQANGFKPARAASINIADGQSIVRDFSLALLEILKPSRSMYTSSWNPLWWKHRLERLSPRAK